MLRRKEARRAAHFSADLYIQQQEHSQKVLCQILLVYRAAYNSVRASRLPGVQKRLSGVLYGVWQSACRCQPKRVISCNPKGPRNAFFLLGWDLFYAPGPFTGGCIHCTCLGFRPRAACGGNSGAKRRESQGALARLCEFPGGSSATGNGRERLTFLDSKEYAYVRDCLAGSEKMAQENKLLKVY